LPPLSLHCSSDHAPLHSFPTRRSSDLRALTASASRAISTATLTFTSTCLKARFRKTDPLPALPLRQPLPAHSAKSRQRDRLSESDRKSTRLNSSHVAISYAVFCLKKKK